LREKFEFQQHQSLLFQVENKLVSESKEVMKELRMQVVDNPNFTEEFIGFRLHNLKLNQIIGLAYSSWLLPKELSVMIQLDVEEYSRKLCLEDQFIVKTILESQSAAQEWLIDTNMWHTRDFFGNILPVWINTLKRLSFRKVNKKLKKLQRKRGYHDHGTLAPSHTWTPSHDWSLTEKQNDIEEERNIFQDTLNLLKGWFE
jgi:hypothetical protein